MAEHIANTFRKKRGPYNQSQFLENIKEPRSTAWFKKKKSNCSVPASLEHPVPSTAADSYHAAQGNIHLFLHLKRHSYVFMDWIEDYIVK